MLTRLKVSGFKNLSDVDIRFGPFTCIAGGNGVGKSNLFDAIKFLSFLSDKPFSDAASSLRTKNDSFIKGSSIVNVFHRVGGEYTNKISFEVEMIIPQEGEDELGQPAKATYNFLKYTLILGLNTSSNNSNSKGFVQILKEDLSPINKSKANKHLLFNHAYKWRNTVIQGKRNVPFISTIMSDKDETLINLHQDGGSSGKPRPFLAKNLPRTVLSTARYSSETPTILLARREMQSWKLLQLEPSSLRNPDELAKYSYRSCLGSDGANLPSTIYRLENYNSKGEYEPDNSIYTQLANRLAELIQDVKAVEVDKDEKRQLLTLQIVGKDGTSLPARSLSDGTLRFLALAVLDLDYSETGLICLEEPENGIHPERVPAILDLLQSIPVDPFEESSPDNPLRQVIINTHSPKVVREIPEQSLVYIELKEFIKNNKTRYKGAVLSALPDTWRVLKGRLKSTSKGKLLSYLNPNNTNLAWVKWAVGQKENIKKVKEREDLKALQQTKLFQE